MSRRAVATIVLAAGLAAAWAVTWWHGPSALAMGDACYHVGWSWGAERYYARARDLGQRLEW